MELKLPFEFHCAPLALLPLLFEQLLPRFQLSDLRSKASMSSAKTA